jgi:hypothetical protein
MLKKMEKQNKKRTKLYLAHESERRNFYTSNRKCEDTNEPDSNKSLSSQVGQKIGFSDLP